jgi:hypothetical protein
MKDVIEVILAWTALMLPTAGTVAVILTIARNRHRERMKMIEQGIVPPAALSRRTGNFYSLLIVGAVVFALGTGLLVAGLVNGKPVSGPGTVFGLAGLAMVACFVVVRKLNPPRRQEPDQAATSPPV